MSIWVKLPKEKEKLLEEEAKRHGMEVSEYARMLLEKDLSQSPARALGPLWRKGMFPQLKDVTEEDIERAKWRPRNIEL